MRQFVRCVLTLIVCLVLSLSGLLAGVPAARAADTGTWIQLPVSGGGVLSLAINPITPSTLYAGTINGGVFRSADSGTTWTAVNTGLTNTSVWALAINPATPTTVYAGTDGGAGVYRSTDSGATWTGVSTGLTNPYVYALAINPAAPATLYTATDGGVFRSTDSGAHWTAVNTGLTNLEVYALAINPFTPTTLYAGTKGSGAFRSTDSGATWTAVNTGLTNLNVWALAVNPATSTTVYAGTDGGAGVYRSTDSGAHWTGVSTGLTNPKVYALAINPAAPSTLYTSTEGGVFRSTDSGATWTAVNTGLTDLDVWTLAINPVTPTTVYAGTASVGFRYEAASSYALTTTASPSAGGTITRLPNAASYASGTVVTLTATPAAGYTFTGWSGNLTGTTNPTTITMSANRSVTAVFQAGALPDLTVDTLSFNPAQPTPGGAVTLAFTVHNQGLGSVTADYDMSIYVDGVYRSGGTDTDRLANGASDNGWHWDTTWPSDTASHTFMVVLDPNGVITESNESNNSASISASVTPVMYTLTTTTSPSAAGMISRSPNAASYASGTVVTLTALPASGYTFTGWSGDASDASLSTTITMSANRSVTAVFQTGALPDLTVDTLSFNPAQPTPGGAVTLAFTVHNQGLGSVTADYDMSIYVDGVYRSGGTDTDRLANGASDNGWHWDTTWPSDTASHTFMVVLDPNGVITESNESNNSASISASVTPVMYTLTTTTSPSAGGTITRSPNAASYASGTVVTLTAIPAAGYTFTGWEWNKSDSPTIPPTVTMDANKTVTATFTAIPTYRLTPSAGTGGTITPNTVQTVLQGGSTTFTIAPGAGYHIADVSVDGVSHGIISSYSFTNVTSNHSISARFGQEQKQTVIVLQIGNPMFTVNGTSKTLDSPPVIKNGRTLVPIRAIIEALGGTVGWDGTARKATVALGRATIELWIGKNTARVNGVTTPIDAANVKVVPEIINGRTMLPLRFVSESLGCSIVWADATKTITITYLP